MEKVKAILEKAKTILIQLKDKAVELWKKLVKKIKELNISKVKEICKKTANFVCKHKRYFIAGTLFVVFSLAIIFGAGKGNNPFGNLSASGDAGKFEKNKHEDVNTLIENYYVAYASGDREQLVQYIEPLSNNEAEYIELFSSYIEKFTIKNVYTQRGVTEGSYLVSVEMAIKFKGVETEAPGLEFFYVETGREDKLYINNLYSQFNMQVNEYLKDETILAAIHAYEDRAELKELQEKIENEYTNAINSDPALMEMVTTTIARAVSGWMATIEIALNQVPPKGSLSVPDESGDVIVDSEEDTEEEDVLKQEILDVSVTEKVVTIDKTNVRESANTDANLVTTVNAGVELEVIEIDAWGGWTLIKVNDMQGYIRNDLLKTVETEHSVAGLPAYPKVGQIVVIMEDQNAYIKMDENATVIANLKIGTTVTVEMSYANGWSKVSWDDGLMVGYVLTAVLKLD